MTRRPLVLAEVDHLTKPRFGCSARKTVIDHTLTEARRSRFRIPHTDSEILDTAQSVQQRYPALDLDLADAVNVALTATYRTIAILTLDRREFRALRPLTPHKAFRLLPDDL